MADLFKSLKPKAHLSKNGFDLSRKHVFSSKAGQALPCLCVETVPRDHFEIDLTALSRTETFNTAAFVRGKQRFDFFFVPYSQLWHPFNQFITQRSDKHSTLQKNHIYCPVISLGSLLSQVLSSYNNEESDMHAASAYGMIRILDLLGYGDYRWVLGSSSSDDIIEMIDALRGKYVNLFRLAAYQHIWYDYYRNKYYDVDDTGGISTVESYPNYVKMFNFDDVDCGSFANSILSSSDTARIAGLMTMRYIQWKKDLFTSSLPSQQFGAVSSVDIIGKHIVSLATVTSEGFANVTANDDFLSPNSLIVPSSISSSSSPARRSWNIPSAFDILTLRKAEALQAWKQATLRAGNMTDDSFKAHFGVEPYYEGDENVHYLGSFSAALQVNPVESTTASAASKPNNRVGELAATGTILASGNKIKFDCRDYGVIMCIASFLPESEYNSNMLDHANKLYEQFDFFTPEFQNIGLETVTQSEVSLEWPDESNRVIGYVPRYHQYKTAVDKVFGEFGDSRMFSVHQDESPFSVSKVGTLKAWVSPRKEWVLNDGRRLLSTLYVDPAVYNHVFGISADSSQDTDQFIHNVFFDIKAIRPMSVLGLPEF